MTVPSEPKMPTPATPPQIVVRNAALIASLSPPVEAEPAQFAAFLAGRAR